MKKKTPPAGSKIKTALTIVTMAVDQLRPYERNPRKNDHVVARMIASIERFGFAIPILARSDGEVIDGHLRLKAAVQLGLAEVPVILCDDWTPAEVKAFRLLVNRSVNWADWDTPKLTQEFADLEEFGFDLSLTGFDPAEIDALFKDASTPRIDEDALADSGGPVIAKPGDIWQLGTHRLMCGDSTSIDAVQKLLAGAKPNLMVTDPPYGVNYDPKWRNKAGISSSKRTGKVANDDRADWYDAWVLFEGAVAYVWHAGKFAASVQFSLERAQFEIRSQIIWAKPALVISRGAYHWQHEPAYFAVKEGADANWQEPEPGADGFEELSRYYEGHEAAWYGVKEGAKANWQGGRKQSTLWKVDKILGDHAKNAHGTQKPVECMRRPMLNHTRRGEAVYEPFSGSGTTLIAAETIGRICFAMELEPGYVDVAVRRWQQFTGKKAVLVGDGRGFDEVAQAS